MEATIVDPQAAIRHRPRPPAPSSASWPRSARISAGDIRPTACGRGRDLEHQPHLEDLLEVVDRRPQDPDAPVALELDHAPGGELDEGLADRRSRDARAFPPARRPSGGCPAPARRVMIDERTTSSTSWVREGRMPDRAEAGSRAPTGARVGLRRRGARESLDTAMLHVACYSLRESPQEERMPSVAVTECSHVVGDRLHVGGAAARLRPRGVRRARPPCRGARAPARRDRHRSGPGGDRTCRNGRCARSRRPASRRSPSRASTSSRPTNRSRKPGRGPATERPDG